MFGSKKNHVWVESVDFAELATFLRRKYPSSTADHVSRDTGVPVSSVKKWLSLEVEPRGRAAFALVCAYGPALVAATVKRPPWWCNDEVRKAKLAKLRAEIAELEQ